MLQDTFEQYLNKSLEHNFLEYPKQKLSPLYKYYIAAKEIFYEDIRAKYFGRNSTDILTLLQTDSALEAVFYYRLQREIFLKDPNNSMLPYLSSLMKRRTGTEIYYSTRIGEGFVIVHGVGVVIGPNHCIGKSFIIYQGSTIGKKYDQSKEAVTIGDNVIIFAGAKVLGNILIENNVQVAANAVLINNAAKDSIYAGIPAKKVK